MSRLRRWALLGAAILLGGRRGADGSPGRSRASGATPGGGTGGQAPTARDRLLDAPPGDERATSGVLALLALSSLASIAFAVVYVAGGGTQMLGLTLGLVFLGLGGAAVHAGQRLVPQVRREEPLPSHGHPQEVRETAELARRGGAGLSRRRLLKAAAGGSVGLAGAAVALPAASLGPVLETDRLLETPWRAGRRLVDARGRPIEAATLEVGSFLTAFAEGVSERRLDASLMLTRLAPEEVRMPPERAGWAPLGLLAFSKSCTHAGCAVSLFRHPLFDPTTEEARLVCPCHYSAFDPATGGTVVGGPAGRPLPQLPLRIDPSGVVVAAGELSTPPGPSWPLVRD